VSDPESERADRESAGSDVGKNSSGPRFLIIGEVVRPHGLRGELKVKVLTEFPERFRLLDEVYLSDQDDEPRPYQLELVRHHQGFAILKLRTCDDRTAAEKLRGQLVQIPRELAMPLEEGAYYIYQIVGLEVWTEAGEYLGRVVEVLETPANDVYVVQGPRGEILLPAIESVIRRIDLPAQRVTVILLDGLV
jgi:16S rRNA processing protein RimM